MCSPWMRHSDPVRPCRVRRGPRDAGTVSPHPCTLHRGLRMWEEPRMTMDIAPPARQRTMLGTGLRFLLAALVLYVITTLVILPYFWHRYEERHPALGEAPTVTHTRSGIPGDLLDVGLVGKNGEGD